MKTTEYKFHPVSAIFPLLEGTEFRELMEDIRAHGLREPITLYEGKIIDGRNRYRACQELKIEVPTREWSGDSPLAFVLSENLHRRHLSYDERMGLGLKLHPVFAKEAANRVGGRPKKGEKPGPISAQVSGKAAGHTANAVNVGRTQLKEMLAAEKESPDLTNSSKAS